VTTQTTPSCRPLGAVRRVIIEQAKGVVSERRGVELAVAFDLLRGHARRYGLPLTGYARAVAEGAAEVPSLPRASAGIAGDRAAGTGP